jgi:lysophospholipase L1-like esterase
MINLKPDYMSILIGINDVWHEYSSQNGVCAEKYEMVYGLLIEEVKRDLPDLKIMILEPFVLPGSATENNDQHPNRWDYFREETALRREAAKQIAEKYSLLFVPLQDMFDKVNADAPTDNYWLADGVHPTLAGHELIKRRWLEAFEKLK